MQSRLGLKRERFNTRLPVGIDVVLVLNGERIACKSRNLSRGGMFVPIDKPIAPGTALDVEITFEGRTLAGKATVASAMSDGLGIKFVGFTEEFTAGIDAIIAQLRAMAEAGKPVSHDHVATAAAWRYPDEVGRWKRWRTRTQQARLFSLSGDGAALMSKRRPELNEEILMTIGTGEQARQSRAQVVRHTERGFAVRFLSPDEAFRAAIDRLRTDRST